jgi:hypothetical protein
MSVPTQYVYCETCATCFSHKPVQQHHSCVQTLAPKNHRTVVENNTLSTWLNGQVNHESIAEMTLYRQSVLKLGVMQSERLCRHMGHDSL